jgi:hypothetical protein
MEPLFILYCVLASVTIGLTSYLVRAGLMQSRFSRFFGVLALSSTVTLMMVGPLGLILGGPSILLSALLVSRVLDDASKQSQDNKTTVLSQPPTA